MFINNRYLYLQVFKGEIKAQELKSGRSFIMKCHALSHPRTLMGSFDEIQSCFKKIINKIAPKTFFIPSPIIIVHLREEFEGGFTDVELRAFKEAAYGAGGREVFMPKSGKALSNRQIKEVDFHQYKDA